MMYGFGCSGGYGFIIPILLLLILIFTAYKLVSNTNKVDHNNALNDLNNKFVNGDISEEEYLKKKQLIKK